MTYDVKIAGGTIVDGTGRPRFVGDLGIRDGVVVDVGDAPESGTQTLDATGRVVTPGFIDQHTHYDAQVLWDPMLSHSPWHGVTTVLFGNCGVGFAPCREQDRDFMMEMCELVEGIPYDCLKEGMGDWGFETFPQYMDLVERRGVGINCAVNLPHHPTKVFVQGHDAADRVPSDDEMAEQCRILEEALEAGAAGMSVFNGIAHWGPGGKPVPSRLTLPEQFDQFMEVIDRFGTGNMEVNVGPTFNTRSAERLTKMFNLTWNHVPTDFDTAAKLAREGKRWFPQTSVPGTSSFEVSLEDPFMFAIDKANQLATPLHDLFDSLGTPAQRLAAYRDASFVGRFVEETGEQRWRDFYWPMIVVSYCPQHPEEEGRQVIEIAEKLGRAPGEVMLRQAVESELEARWIVSDSFLFDGSDEHLIDAWLHNPAVRLGNGDAGAHQGQLAGYRWPTVFLARYVRGQDFPLERAVQMMSSVPAESIGLRDRGTLEPGRAADAVVFDLDTVEDGPIQRVNDLPHGARRLFSDAIGIDYVLVNGTVIRDHGATVVDLDALPGTLLREFVPNAERRPSQIAGV